MVRQSSQGSDVLVREAQRLKRCVPGQASGTAIWVKRSVSGELSRLQIGLASGSLPLTIALLGLASSLSDGDHVGSVCGDGCTAFLACPRRCFWIEAMGSTVRVGGLPSLRAHNAQRVRVHHREAATLFRAGSDGGSGGGLGL